MSIREDARNDRMLRDILGYDPRDEIAHLRDERNELMAENRKLKEENKKLKSTLSCHTGCRDNY